jgi:hypothetical protein
MDQSKEQQQGATSAVIDSPENGSRTTASKESSFSEDENINQGGQFSIQKVVRTPLGGQCKTGHAGSLQNRPYEMARDVMLFIPLSPDQASMFWFSNSAAHI